MKVWGWALVPILAAAMAMAVDGARAGDGWRAGDGARAGDRARVAGSETIRDADPAPIPDPDPEWPAAKFGLHMDLNFDGYGWRRARAIGIARDLGVEVSRSSFLWAHIEPVRGRREWSRPDAVVAELEAAGIEPVFAIYGSPSWANGVSESTPEAHLHVPVEEEAFRMWVSEYAGFVRAAAERYRGRVRKWELWNEQNDVHFWKPKPDVDHYVHWYRAIESTIRAIDATAEVALGGLSGLCCVGPDGINGFTFLQGLYDRGLKPAIVNIHPYSDHAPDVHQAYTGNFRDVEAIREIMVRNGEGHRPIWVTEWGWPTHVAGTGEGIPERVQAAYIAMSLEMILRDYPYVTLATYFLDYDRPPHFFHGLVTSEWRLKESADRFRSFMLNRAAVRPARSVEPG